MVCSFCQYGVYAVWKWVAGEGGNLWRTTGDISDNWELTLIGFQQDGLEESAGPGHWNDAPGTKAILTNRDVIALDQDELGHPGSRIWSGRETATAFFNRGNCAMDFSPDLKRLKEFQGKHLWDVWARKEVVLDPTLRVPSHGSLLEEQR